MSHSVSIPAPANVAAGDVVVAGALVGIAAHAAVANAELVVYRSGAFDRTVAVSVTLGDILYWHAGSGVLNKTASAGVRFGIALATASAGTVRVELAP